MAAIMATLVIGGIVLGVASGVACVVLYLGREL